MLLGVGNDVVHIVRIERALSRWGQLRFMQRIFTKEEILQIHNVYPIDKAAAHVAGRFASKEAVFKAISPIHRLKWRDFSVLKEENSSKEKSIVKLKVVWNCPKAIAALQNRLKVFVSITHDGNYAHSIAIAAEGESSSSSS